VKEGADFTAAIEAEKIGDWLGVLKFRDTLAHEKSEVGLVTGLAWTEVGGSILSTEATAVDGKGKLTLTGKLGDVMQESAQAAMSYIRSRALRLGLSRDFLSQPRYSRTRAGRCDSQGWPSAGITIATALASALSRIPVRRDIAMTEKSRYAARCCHRRPERKASRCPSRRAVRSDPAAGKRKRCSRSSGESAHRHEATLRRQHGSGAGHRPGSRCRRCRRTRRPPWLPS